MNAMQIQNHFFLAVLVAIGLRIDVSCDVSEILPPLFPSRHRHTGLGLWEAIEVVHLGLAPTIDSDIIFLKPVDTNIAFETSVSDSSACLFVAFAAGPPAMIGIHGEDIRRLDGCGRPSSQHRKALYS